MPRSQPTSRPLERTSTPGVYRRGNRYVVRVKDRHGRQLQRSARTLIDARKVKAALVADIARGEFRGTSRDTLASYADSWIETYRGRTARGIRRFTIEDYRADLRDHILPVLRLVDIEARDLKVLVARLRRRA
jgi:integrase